jgi:hypothetical protein
VFSDDNERYAPQDYGVHEVYETPANPRIVSRQDLCSPFGSLDLGPAHVPSAAEPERAGLATIPTRMQQFVDQGQIAGAVSVVGRHDKILSHEAVGRQDIEAQRPMTKDALCPMPMARRCGESCSGWLWRQSAVTAGVDDELVFFGFCDGFPIHLPKGGPPALAQVFLFGERKSTLKVEPIDGSAVASVALGGDAESTTTTDQERASRQVKLPSWTSAEFAYRGSRYLFLVNSANAPAAFSVGGTPVDTGLEDVFTGAAVTPRRGEPLRFDLPAYGVTGVRMTLTEEGNPR